MGPLFAYSLVPVLSVALLLCFTATLRARDARGLALYCLTVAMWSGALLMLCLPRTAWLGERLVSMGTFTAAGFLHAAYNVTKQRSYGLVVFAYLVALGLTVLGAVEPNVLYGPLAMTRGPLFWPAMVLAVVAATVPLMHLVRAYRVAPPERRPLLRGVGIAGVLTYTGGISNALLLSGGYALPFGMYLVLGGLLVLSQALAGGARTGHLQQPFYPVHPEPPALRADAVCGGQGRLSSTAGYVQNAHAHGHAGHVEHSLTGRVSRASISSCSCQNLTCWAWSCSWASG